MPPLKLAFLGSTNGTTFKALYPWLKKEIEVEVSLVLANCTCGFLDFAREKKLPNALLLSIGKTRKAFELELMALLEQHQIDVLVLCGFMRILSKGFTDKWQEKTINVHPSLLPKHKGLMDLAVHQAVIDKREDKSGCSVHLVSEAVDEGKVLLQKSCPVLASDDANSLKKRVQALEPIALLDAIYLLKNAMPLASQTEE